MPTSAILAPPTSGTEPDPHAAGSVDDQALALEHL